MEKKKKRIRYPIGDDWVKTLEKTRSGPGVVDSELSRENWRGIQVGVVEALGLKLPFLTLGWIRSIEL